MNKISLLFVIVILNSKFCQSCLIVDMNETEKPFGDVADELAQIGEEIGVIVKCQREEIFEKMHRI